MERLCGILLPLVHSKSHPYKNLTNNIILFEKFNHLSFILPLFYKISNRPKLKEYSNNRVFILNNYSEELYWPSKKYSLKTHEVIKLKNYYSSLFQLSKKKLVSGFLYLNLLFYIYKGYTF
jgi:hypothetical protein